MIRKVFLTISFFLVLVGVAALTAIMVLKPEFDRQLQRWVKTTEGKSFELRLFDYGKIYFLGNSFVFKNIRAQGITRFEHPYFSPREFDLKISSMRLGLMRVDFSGIKVQVQINGLDARGGQLLNESLDDHERIESVSKMDFQTQLAFSANPKNWKKQAVEKFHAYKDWVFKDAPTQNLSMRGRAVFLVDDWPISVRFHSVQNEKGDVHLEGNSEDLRIIAEMIEPKFTESDLKLASENLIRMPKLLKFRREAEMKAVHLSRRDPEIAYDTIRHIFWSYWLAKAYGREFAKLTTDAHEIDDETNSAEESEKDRHHNALGIEFAEKELTESQVEKMIFEDPRVIRKKKIPKKIPAKKNVAAPVSSAVLP
ncbi:MAG TPA: hypothetical protein PLY88_07615 [Candidatus Omnitrophota bacterium]|nr:hypothetical protein [Candidatus Omnitrophota bacterium]